MASASEIVASGAAFDRVRPGEDTNVRAIALAIGLGEADFGLHAPWLMPDGKPSYTWGLLIGSGTNGSVVHEDKNPDGSIRASQPFQAFHNQDEAVAAFWGTWARADTLAAARSGDASETARAMYGHGYFGGAPPKGVRPEDWSAEDRIQAYASMIERGARQVAGALGEKNSVHMGERRDGVPWRKVGAVALLVFAFWRWRKFAGKRKRR